MSQKFTVDDIKGYNEQAITPSQVVEMHKVVEKARDSEKPFLVNNNDQLSIIGDPNDTEKETISSIKMRFCFGKDEFEKIPEDAQVVGNKVYLTREFKDVEINPNDCLRSGYSLMKLMPFFHDVDKLTEKMNKKIASIDKNDTNYQKKVDDITNDYGVEVIRLIAWSNDDVRKALNEFVASVLGIDDTLKDKMDSYYVFTCFYQIIDKNPNILNEFEVLFG